MSVELGGEEDGTDARVEPRFGCDTLDVRAAPLLRREDEEADGVQVPPDGSPDHPLHAVNFARSVVCVSVPRSTSTPYARTSSPHALASR